MLVSLSIALAQLSVELDKHPALAAEPAPIEEVQEIKRFIVEQALLYAFPAQLALDIADGESRYDCTALGDTTPMKDGIPAFARGCWQITRKYHPEVSDECAFDIRCSTIWFMEYVSENPKRLNEWTVYRNLTDSS